uniref:Meis_PKNOX_N domain-containing protein n=1 Tax=Parastrongyloides trichosuri TaxID=131310 RepID=A0A0N4ZIT4_PARTI
MRTGNKELDDFMINMILQFRINMAELTKVGLYCEEFKTRYIKSFSKLLGSQSTLKTLLEEEEDIKNDISDDFPPELSNKCPQIVVKKDDELLINFLNGEQALLQVLEKPTNKLGSS